MPHTSHVVSILKARNRAFSLCGPITMAGKERALSAKRVRHAAHAWALHDALLRRERLVDYLYGAKF